MQVVVVAPGHLPSTRIVLTQLLETLEKNGVLNWCLERERASLDVSAFENAGIVIFFRCSELQTILLAQLAHLSGAVVVYAADDNLLEVPKGTRDGAYFQNRLVRRIMKKLIGMADAMLVYSGTARDYFTKLNPHTVLLECLPATPCTDNASKSPGSPGIVIGYAGTATHEADFQPVIPALQRLLGDVGNLRCDFVGFCPSELVGAERVTQTPWIDRYEDFLRELALRRWDIGIAPLKDTLFNNCKTNLKFREYAACGVAGIYSDIPLYRGSVRNEENGLLVSNTTQAWYEGIRRLIDSPELRDTIRANATQDVKTKYNIEKSSEELLRILRGLPAEKQRTNNASILGRKKLLYALLRPIGLALAVLCQAIAGLRRGTLWRDAHEAFSKRYSTR